MVRNRFRNTRAPPGSLGLPIIGQTLELLKAMRDGRCEEWLQQIRPGLQARPVRISDGIRDNKFVYTSDGDTLSNKQPQSIRRLLGPRNLFDHKRLRGALLSFLKPEAVCWEDGSRDQIAPQPTLAPQSPDLCVAAYEDVDVQCDLYTFIWSGERRAKGDAGGWSSRAANKLAFHPLQQKPWSEIQSWGNYQGAYSDRNWKRSKPNITQISSLACSAWSRLRTIAQLY